MLNLEKENSIYGNESGNPASAANQKNQRSTELGKLSASTAQSAGAKAAARKRSSRRRKTRRSYKKNYRKSYRRTYRKKH